MARGLKDWYVQFESIKTDNRVYQKYVLSQSRHPNQKIEQFSKNTIPYLDSDLSLYNDFKNGRGNRPKKNGYAIHMSLPFDLKKEEWIKCYSFCLTEMWKDKLTDLKVNNKHHEVIIAKLLQRVYAVGHKGDHVHLNVPTIFFNEQLQLVLKISQKKFQHRLKQNFNKWLEKNKNISKHTYMVNDEKIPKKSQKQAKKNRNKIIVDELDNELHRISKEIDKLRGIAETIPIDKNKAYIDKQLNTAEEQLKNGNDKRSISTVKRVQKALNAPIPKSDLFK